MCHLRWWIPRAPQTKTWTGEIVPTSLVMSGVWKKGAQAAGKLCVIWLSWLIGSEVEGLIEQAPSSLVVLWLIVMLGSVVYRCSDHKFVSVQASIVPSWQANAIGYYMDWCSVGSRLALDLMAVFFSAKGSNCVNLNEWQTWMKLSVCFEQFGFLWFLDPWEVSEGWPHHSSILAIAQELTLRLWHGSKLKIKSKAVKGN